MKRKLLFAAFALLLGVSNASAIMLETDLTRSFNSLATTQWTGSSGQVGWAAPQVTTNSGLTVAAWESYCGDWNGGCTNTGTIMKTTVTGLTPGTYKIELYGAAAFTFNRGFGSEAFTGDSSIGGKAVSDTYTAGQSIDTETGVVLYANTSEGNYSQEIPIWYADNFNGSGLSTAILNDVVVGSNGQIEIGMSKTSKSTNWHVVQLKGVTATVDGDAVIEALKSTANSLLNNDTYANVTGSERVALQSANNASPAADTQEAYQAVITDLNSAISAFENCNYAAYDALAAEIARAKALGLSDETADSYAATSSSTAATVSSNIQGLMVAEYTYVTTNYSYGVSLGAWTTVNAVDRSSQHWDGTSQSTYSEQNVGWGDNSWECSYSQNLTLPAGKYVFKVAGRKSSDSAVLTLTVKNGEATIGTVNDFPNGDTGLGINKSGATSFDADDAEGFAKNPNHEGDDLQGCGWQWRYVKFILADPATVNVAVTASASAINQWVGFCNPTVQTDDADNVALMEALVALNNAKTAATLTQRTNVGTEVFQYTKATDDALWSAYSTAKTNAEAFTLSAGTKVDDVKDLTSALTTATTIYNNNAALNQPDANKRYWLSIVDAGQAWDGNAVTFLAGDRADMGGYNVKYLTPSNANMNQALKFTAVAGEANTYKVSAINVADGEERYITTGSTYGGNNAQIRTTDDASKASWVKISPTSTNGQFQLLNVSDGNNVIARNADNPDNGMYTSGTANFTIAEAAQASVTINIPAEQKYATAIFPFTPELPSGVVAYSCEAKDGNKLTLVKVDEPAANVPYILYAADGCVSTELKGWGTATKDSYETGWLTGVYSPITAASIDGKYVLQDQNGTVAFYQIDINENDQVPNIGAYRAYLSVSEATVKAFYFGDIETAIQGVKSETENDAIYNLAGQRVNRVKKGVYIVDGKKVLF